MTEEADVGVDLSPTSRSEEADVGVDLSPTSGSEQQGPHFLKDVIFHGKFKVSFSTRDRDDSGAAKGELRQDKVTEWNWSRCKQHDCSQMLVVALLQ